LNEVPEKGPMPMKLEAWPGGRWYRDLGKKTATSGARAGRSSAHLLEFCGPLFMFIPGFLQSANTDERKAENADQISVI